MFCRFCRTFTQIPGVVLADATGLLMRRFEDGLRCEQDFANG